MAKQKFPYEDSEDRLRSYELNQALLNGEHFKAFVQQGGTKFLQKYENLRFVVCNFSALISKVMADMMFGEPPEIKSKHQQEWLEMLDFENQLSTQFYESALNNSAKGDQVHRIRVIDKKIVLDRVEPDIFFPKFKKSGAKNKMYEVELGWIEEKSDARYLIKEIHTVGKIEIKIYTLNDKGEIENEYDIQAYNAKYKEGYVPETPTGIDRLLLVHIPNYRMSDPFWGVSDYHDLLQLFFALDNRMTKIDNILDTHSDPILAVPAGVIDEEGNVKKESFNLFEVDMTGQKPEYIVWNASLENAFAQIEKIVEFLFMMSETSPDAMGLGKGQAESGRALKMRLLRTIAKKKRKELYYTQGMKELLYTAQLLAKKGGYKVGDLSFKGEPEIPEITFQDGVVNDERETIENEIMKLGDDLTTKERAIMRIEGISQDEAKDVVEKIEKENEGNNFNSIVDEFTNRQGSRKSDRQEYEQDSKDIQ